MNVAEVASIEDRPSSASSRFARATPLISVACFVLFAALFARQQSIWVDETTQLSGLTLSPIESAAWLAGEDAHRFGVPPDRTPPLSYWVGWGFSQVFGLSESSMRWFGIACVALAILIVHLTAQRLWGMRAGMVAGLIIALSPNAIEFGVEIRAYPLFLLLASIGTAALCRYVIAEPTRRMTWLLVLAASGLLMSYTHFFGLVAAGALFASVLVLSILRRHGVISTLLVGGVTLLLSAGLVPFITSASDVSGDGGAVTFQLPAVGDVARYGYRSLAGHPAMTVVRPAAILASAGAGVLGLAALAPKRQLASTTWVVLLALIAGMVVILAASCFVTTFEVLRPSYSIWRMPMVALVCASALSARHGGVRKAAVCAAALAVGGSAFAAGVQVWRGDLFRHGPHESIAAIAEELDGSVQIVHESPAQWGQAYYPLRYHFGVELTQWAGVEGQSGVGLVRQLPDSDQALDVSTLDGRFVVVLRDQAQFWRDQARVLQGEKPTVEPGPLAARLIESDNWREARREWLAGMMAVQIIVFERSADSNGT